MLCPRPRFCPSCRDSIPGDFLAAFWGYLFEATLPPDVSAPCSHLYKKRPYIGW
jgi:hypothetical protein